MRNSLKNSLWSNFLNKDADILLFNPIKLSWYPRCNVSLIFRIFILHAPCTSFMVSLLLLTKFSLK